MVRSGRATYMMNPSIFSRGRWLEIIEKQKSFELKVSYSSEAGRVIKGIEVVEE